MTNDAVARVRYFPGQYLRTVDFMDEQSYHLAMRRRHNIGHHTFGIVSGLRVLIQDGIPVVEPGMAVDGYGRELILVRRTPLDVPRAFAARGTDRLDVWLAYNLVDAEEAPVGYATCLINTDTNYRQVEMPLIRYTTPDPDQTDRRHPDTVPEGDRDFGPSRVPPDSPTEDWPVFLGTMTRSQDDGVDEYTVDDDHRPYAGLVGEEIVASSGRATVQIGAERAEDPFRFAVRIPDGDNPEVPRIAVLRQGAVALVGRTTVLGNVEVKGVVAIDAVEDVDDQGPQPWTISHQQGAGGNHELRIQMAHEDGSDQEVVVGAWRKVPQPDGSEADEFAPCLTIDSECKVTVHGDLVVEGTLISDDRRPLSLDPIARAMIRGGFLSGVSGASVLVDSFYRTTLPSVVFDNDGSDLR